MQRSQILANALAQPDEAIRRYLPEAIRQAEPGRIVVRVAHLQHSTVRYAEAGHCTIAPAADFVCDETWEVCGDEVNRSPEAGWYRIEWMGSELELVTVELASGYHRQNHEWLVAPSEEVLAKFLIELDIFDNDLTGVVLVFQNGCWQHSEELHDDIQSSTFDNLVLAPGLAERICDDVQGWLDAKELYESHGVPWKRGMILIGPPRQWKDPPDQGADQSLRHQHTVCPQLRRRV